MKFTSVNLLDELAKPEFSSLLSAFQERRFARQSMIFSPSYDDEADLAPVPTAERPYELELARQLCFYSAAGIGACVSGLRRKRIHHCLS